jgi:hypothetical protein
LLRFARNDGHIELFSVSLTVKEPYSIGDLETMARLYEQESGGSALKASPLTPHALPGAERR